MFFRPLPVLTLFAFPALVLLVWLGNWQLGRMSEKVEAITAWETRDVQPAASLDEAFCDERSDPVGRQISVEPQGEDTALFFQGRSFDGEPGWLIMVAMDLPECASAHSRSVLVQTGFQDLRSGAVQSVHHWQLAHTPRTGAFAAENDIEAAQFYRYDVNDIDAVLGVSDVSVDYWLVEASNSIPPELAAVPPSQHLGYALTWFGLAIVLFVFYVLMHLRSGRMSFTQR